MIVPLVRFLGATSAIQEQAVSYLRYILTFSPFLLLSFLLGRLARNDGRPKLAMFALAFGSVLNMVLDYVLMYPINMGISGAALATALGPIFSVIILMPHFLMKRGNLYFVRISMFRTIIKGIMVLGFPSFIMEFTIGIITFVYNFAIVRNGFGELGLAAYLILGYLMLIILTIFLGMAEGLQPVFSYYAGLGDEVRNKEMRSLAVKMFLGIGICCYLVVLVCSRTFVTIFAPNDPLLIEFTQSKCAMYFSCFFLAGYNILMISYWQSSKQTKQALLISMMRSLIVPPTLLLVLPSVLHSEIIWICHSLSELVTAAAVVVLWRKGESLSG